MRFHLRSRRPQPWAKMIRYSTINKSNTMTENEENNPSLPLNYTDWLRLSAAAVGRLYFWIALAYILLIILYDAFSLITADIVLLRWITAGAFTSLSIVLWLRARQPHMLQRSYQRIIYGYIALGIVFASVNVFMQRGMAAKAVLLYLIPLLVSGLLLKRTMIFAVAGFSIIAYTTVALWYFIANPSEGYKVELYGEIGFYSAMLFIAAGGIWQLIRSKNSDPS